MSHYAAVAVGGVASFGGSFAAIRVYILWMRADLDKLAARVGDLERWRLDHGKA